MKKSDIHVGDKVDFLRMNNKAVKLSGTIEKVHDDPSPCVDIRVDGKDGGLETAQIEDLTFGDRKQSKERLSVGQHVRFLRMSNKAVELTGVIEKIQDDPSPCVDIRVDGKDGGLETAHVNDVTVTDEKASIGGEAKPVHAKPATGRKMQVKVTN
jgi:hypothetical protein